MSGPNEVGVWVIRWADPRGMGLFASGPKGVGSICVGTQWGLGVRSGGDLMRLRDGSVFGPKGVGSLSGPKRVGVWVRVWA